VRSSTHGDVATTLLIVIGAVYWVGIPGMVLFVHGPGTVAGFGVAGAAVGAWLAARIRPDLRPGEAALASALAVPLLLEMTRWGGHDALSGAAVAAAILGGAGAAAAAFWVARATRPGGAPGVHVVASGAIAAALLGVSVLVMMHLDAAWEHEAVRFGVLAGGALVGGAVAAALIPPAPRHVVLGQLALWVTMGVVGPPGWMYVIGGETRAALVVVAGVAGAAVVAEVRRRRPPPSDDPRLPPARLT
jgi:hypothetical protein